MATYYTDQEILNLIEDKDTTKLVEERFNQKNSTIQRCQERLNAAAEHMGHQLITDLLGEEY